MKWLLFFLPLLTTPVSGLAAHSSTQCLAFAQELKSCEEQARILLSTNSYFTHPGWEVGTSNTIVEVSGSPRRSVTIYLPVSSDGGPPECAYYEFVDPSPFIEGVFPFSYVERGAQRFLLVQFGSILPNGVKSPQCGRHVDSTGRYYVSSGATLGLDSDSVVLRDLQAGTSRVVVPAEGGTYFSDPWFQGKLILFSHSGALWQVDAGGARKKIKDIPTPAVQQGPDWKSQHQQVEDFFKKHFENPQPK